MRLVVPLRSRGRTAAVALAAAALTATTVVAPVAANASSPTTSSSTVLTLSSTKTAGIPASIAPGYHTFILKESTAQAHRDPRGVTIMQLAKGYTRAMLMHDMRASQGSTVDLKAFARATKNMRALGGLELESDFTATGDRFTVYLTPGTYVIDNGPSQDGARDVLTPLVVKGKAVGKKAPTVGTITSHEYAFKVAGAKAGKHMYALHNAGAQIHMYIMMRVDKGKTLADVMAALESDTNGPPPSWVANAGFAGVLSGGQTMYTTLNFSSHYQYLLLCFMPDLKTGTPHALLGMVRLFSVK